MKTVSVCVGSACHLKGAYEIIDIFQNLIKANGLSESVLLKGSFCLGKCCNGVSVKLDEGEIMSVTVEDARNFFEKNFL